jgi:hypothetical protein
MGFKRSSNSKPEKAATSNPRHNGLDDEETQKQTVCHNKNTKIKNLVSNDNIRYASDGGTIIIRGMGRNTVNRELMLLEYEDGFDERSLKGKIREVLRRGSVEMNENIYDLVLQESQPDDWLGFKQFVVEFCLNESM